MQYIPVCLCLPSIHLSPVDGISEVKNLGHRLSSFSHPQHPLPYLSRCVLARRPSPLGRRSRRRLSRGVGLLAVSSSRPSCGCSSLGRFGPEAPFLSGRSTISAGGLARPQLGPPRSSPPTGRKPPPLARRPSPPSPSCCDRSRRPCRRPLHPPCPSRPAAHAQVPRGHSLAREASMRVSAHCSDAAAG